MKHDACDDFIPKHLKALRHCEAQLFLARMQTAVQETVYILLSGTLQHFGKYVEDLRNRAEEEPGVKIPVCEWNWSGLGATPGLYQYWKYLPKMVSCCVVLDTKLNYYLWFTALGTNTSESQPGLYGWQSPDFLRAINVTQPNCSQSFYCVAVAKSCFKTHSFISKPESTGSKLSETWET